MSRFSRSFACGVPWILGLLCVFPLQGQDFGLFQRPPVDTNYISTLDNAWSIRALTTRKSQVIRIGNDDSLVRLAPNNNWSLGIGIAYQFLLADFSLNLPTSGHERSRRFDVRFTVTVPKHALELGFRWYKGFELTNEDGLELGFRPDIRDFNISAQYLYNPRYDKLSYRVLLSGMHVQKRSTGGFVVGVVSKMNFTLADSSIVPMSEWDEFNEYGRFNDAHNLSIGAVGGYMYSLVLPYDFFLFAAALPGVGLNFGNIDGQKDYTPPSIPSWHTSVRAAVGYMGKRIYVLVNSNWEGTFLRLGNDNRHSYSITSVKIVVGYRFNSEIPFLERAFQKIRL